MPEVRNVQSASISVGISTDLARTVVIHLASRVAQASAVRSLL